MINARFPESLLHEPIAKLGLSLEFCMITEMLGFYSLADLLNLRSNELLKLPGFTQNLLYEYVNFLEFKGLGFYIDP